MVRAAPVVVMALSPSREDVLKALEAFAACGLFRPHRSTCDRVVANRPPSLSRFRSTRNFFFSARTWNLSAHRPMAIRFSPPSRRTRPVHIEIAPEELARRAQELGEHAKLVRLAPDGSDVPEVAQICPRPPEESECLRVQLSGRNNRNTRALSRGVGRIKTIDPS